ncbi:5-formyltetrahydrofolate cyclo-ligase [Paenibacillus popilliae]|uniref:5-formyltetrahydrofolate cyclo-ligase n=1 Tax=Paenibacillus popilliae TaxID=78057 RepID=A0ABY3AKN7_PAEPP|nr:5-formyltetrahydrofolate cyclo-ligase [Paenibacillus sp. SDF0028]TQR42848.1 5-formyltetrahydrofolate cyclo-ligase [Paenibacillus sp. SDF0028]
MEQTADKGILRERFKKRRKAVMEKEYVVSGAEVCNHASAYFAQLREHLKRPLRIFGYWPFGRELDIKPLLAVCLEAGDQIYLPRTIPATRTMTLHRWDEQTTFTDGCFGLREPEAHTDLLPSEEWTSLDVIIVPGIAFDPAGGRLGLGAGYYDRFWQSYRENFTNKQGVEGDLSVVRISCVYSWQITDNVPMEPHDIGVDLLISEEGIIFCERGRISQEELELGLQ